MKFCAVILADTLIPSALRRSKPTYELPFLGFTLTFKTGQGELTPYQEVQQDLALAFPAPFSCRDWVVIDGGANIGLFSLFMKEARTLVAIEPNPEVAGRLNANFQKNHLRGIVLNQALSDHEGPMKMAISPDTTVLSKMDDHGNVPVSATTIDRILEKYNVPEVDLLKLDLEGHEPAALAGAKESLAKGLIKRVYAEFIDAEALKTLDRLLSPTYKRTVTLAYNALYVRKGVRA